VIDRAVGDRIEGLLDELHATVDPATWARVQEVLNLVTELYGAALATIVEEAPPSLLSRLVADDLVASLLILHRLHPDDLAIRVEKALEGVRPYLATHGGNVELIGVDDDQGAVLIRLLGSCDGCPSSSITLKLAVERAIAEGAPEVTKIVVEDSATDTPITLSQKPVMVCEFE
jgi:Fe-S cluster biogenesis protein NfuA